MTDTIATARHEDEPRQTSIAYTGTKRQLTYRLDGSTLVLEDLAPDAIDLQGFHQVVDVLWSGLEATRLRVPRPLVDTLPLPWHIWVPDEDGCTISRSAFYQVREGWLAPELWPVMPETPVDDGSPTGPHPRRSRMQPGIILYTKHLAPTGERFELRRAEVDRDHERFHAWQNDPRVARAWEEDGPPDQTRAYLTERLDDPHCEPLIGTIDGTPFAYIETYWGPEDRLGPHYDPHPYDHGYHLLVGDPRFLGSQRTAAWMKAVSHYLFLLDPRTRRLVAEPHVDNEKVADRAREGGWYEVKTFEFPHKPARLMFCDRQSFFQEQRL